MIVPVEDGPSTSASLRSSDSIVIPSHWRPETKACINRKVLTCESRLDIIRTLVTLMNKFGPPATKHQMEEVARKLVLKYPFMKDDLGSGYVSSSRYT